MRVIAGTARSLPLKAAEGTTQDLLQIELKKLFLICYSQILPDVDFLIYTRGSGAIGIEALSRGAKEAVLVENARAALAVIKDNLAFTKLDSKAVIMEQDVLSAINRLAGKGVFDIIFMDPPYGKDYEYDVLNALSHSDIIDKYTIIIIEEALHVPLDYINECGFETIKVKNYKTNKHIFIRLKESE